MLRHILGQLSAVVISTCNTPAPFHYKQYARTKTTWTESQQLSPRPLLNPECCTHNRHNKLPQTCCLNEFETNKTLWQNNKKPGMVVHTCNPTSWEVEAGESEVQGHPWPQSNSKVRLCYKRLFKKKKKVWLYNIVFNATELSAWER